MAYRDAPRQDPLVVVGTAGVQCLDPITGELLWSHRQHFSGVVRCAPSGEMVLITDDATLLVLSRDEGRVLNSMELWFHVATVVVHGEFVVLAGVSGGICFRAGVYQWGVRRVENSWRVENVRGELVGELPFWAAHGESSDVGLVLGSAVAQPDRNT